MELSGSQTSHIITNEASFLSLGNFYKLSCHKFKVSQMQKSHKEEKKQKKQESIINFEEEKKVQPVLKPNKIDKDCIICY